MMNERRHPSTVKRFPVIFGWSPGYPDPLAGHTRSPQDPARATRSSTPSHDPSPSGRRVLPSAIAAFDRPDRCEDRESLIRKTVSILRKPALSPAVSLGSLRISPGLA